MKRTLAFFTLLVLLTGHASAQRVAITLDDGPMLERTPLMSPRERNDAIVRHLTSRGVQAMFFVTVNRGADRPEGRQPLGALSQAGQLVANHTVTHPDFNDPSTRLEDFEAEVDTCDAVIRDYAGYRRFLRFPYLREGAQDTKRDAIRAFLRERGYRIGYVSIDDSDWLIDEELVAAAKSNPSLELAPWRSLYLDHLWRHAQAYDSLARSIYGREVPQVLLLHHRLLNALFLGDVIDMFRARGWSVISPEEAFSDGAYKVAPRIPRLDGSVLETTAQALGVSLAPLREMGSERQVGEAAAALRRSSQQP
ncbi:polysaccharide deacetylase family protein [Ramlibacter sp. MMS24-I3-19]|uniref:polysaccharide deacetylase family protein n=1 Tax=Ramlibacter sp. MMS24-I3-19 TaxID=3416606 RepID=UPI003D044F59